MISFWHMNGSQSIDRNTIMVTAGQLYQDVKTHMAAYVYTCNVRSSTDTSCTVFLIIIGVSTLQ